MSHSSFKWATTPRDSHRFSQHLKNPQPWKPDSKNQDTLETKALPLKKMPDIACYNNTKESSNHSRKDNKCSQMERTSTSDPVLGHYYPNDKDPSKSKTYQALSPTNQNFQNHGESTTCFTCPYLPNSLKHPNIVQTTLDHPLNQLKEKKYGKQMPFQNTTKHEEESNT